MPVRGGLQSCELRGFADRKCMAVGGERPRFSAGKGSVTKGESGVLTSCVFSAILLFYVAQIAFYASQLDIKIFLSALSVTTRTPEYKLVNTSDALILNNIDGNTAFPIKNSFVFS